MTEHHARPEAPDDAAPGRLRPIVFVLDEVHQLCTNTPPSALANVLARARTAGIVVFPCSNHTVMEVPS